MDEIYKRFVELSQSDEYLFDYKQIISLNKRIQASYDEIFKKRPGGKELSKERIEKLFLKDLQMKVARIEILDKWKLQGELNPKWKISRKKLDGSIGPGSTKGKVFYAIKGGPILSHEQLVKRKTREVSDLKFDMEERMKKFFTYFLYKNTKISLSSLSRIFCADKKNNQ